MYPHAAEMVRKMGIAKFSIIIDEFESINVFPTKFVRLIFIAISICKITIHYLLTIHYTHWRAHVHNPSKESTTQLEHTPMTSSCQKPFPCSVSFHNNDSYTSFTCNSPSRVRIVVFITDPFFQNVTAHTLDHPNNRYRKRLCWPPPILSSREPFSDWLHPPKSHYLQGGEVLCGQSCRIDVYAALRRS